MNYPKNYFDVYYDGLMVMRERMEDSIPPNEGAEHDPGT